jgi:hypothetical protein
VRLHDGLSYRDTALWLAALAGHAPTPVPAPHDNFVPFTRWLRLEHELPFLAEKGITPATARRFETGRYPGPGFLKGCVAVRLHDPRGQPVGYAGRRLNPDQARRYGKWKLPPRFPKRSILFNFHRVRGDLAQGLVIVEDPWSVMRLAQLAVPAVALLGTSLSDTQHTLLEPVPRLALMLDGDTAGAAATQTLRARFPPLQTRTARLPEDLDPDQLDDREWPESCVRCRCPRRGQDRQNPRRRRVRGVRGERPHLDLWKDSWAPAVGRPRPEPTCMR